MRALSAVAVLLLGALAAPASVRADDWAALLPGCGHPPAHGVPRRQLLYPRPGLPAVVHAGSTLVARVRLPTPLTPPPGIQQPRALARWSGAILRARAAALFAPDGAVVLEQRHRAEVIDVRPDDPQSLVYRVSIPLPAWLAPGTYDLELGVPGGRVRATGLLRVLAPGAPARLSPWPSEPSEPREPGGAALSAMPVDVWIGEPPEPGLEHGAPVLDPRGLVAALRVGDALHVLGDCRGRYLPHRAQVDSLLREQRLRRAPLPGSPLAAVQRAQLQRGPRGGRYRVALAADAPSAVELGLIWAAPGPAELRADRAKVRFHPALPLGEVPALLAAHVTLSPGGSLSLAPGTAAPPDLRLAVAPRPAIAGSTVTLAAHGAAKTALALRFDARRTRFGPGPARVVMRQPGLRPFLGLAITEDGQRWALSGELEVLTARAVGCSLEPGRAPDGGAPAIGLLCALAWLLKRPRLRRPGNRLTARRR